MHYMELGGAEMALIGLLNALDPDKVDVDLFIYSHQGPLMKYIPRWVNLLPENKSYSMIERPMTEALRNGRFGLVAARILGKSRHKRYIKRTVITGDDGSIMQYIGNAVTPLLPKINPDMEYDLCISFLTPHNIGRDKIRAKKRLAWIHTDYSTVHFNTELELPVWNAYDHIAAISPEVGKSFEKAFPTLAHKVVDIQNILSSKFIKTRAEEFDASGELTGHPNLLSIGRFCTAKNYDNVPDIAARIVKSGVKDLKWYIIGFGGSEDLIRQKIVEAEMEDHVILLGKKENPYPYIKACDIYVQPSRYEGKSITVQEAQILGKPVIVTAYPTALSQVKDGEDGIIVPLDNAGCAEAMASLISTSSSIKNIEDYCKSHSLSNESEVNKIYDLLK
ncbi:MAG: glycosyltransferase [Muribaculaceae bacterium]|nr:glycosyltransferase [Muribaculaceae bacterium]